MTIETRPRAALRLSHSDEVAIAARPTDPTHWKCPDCLVACHCVGLARLMPHERCGLAAERT